ncbi:MAG: diol dehydratase reactivase ATPase-like domain-containing protein [Acidimicrobiales bacterium]
MITAGVDIGNATTEVALVERSSSAPRVLAARRAATRGRKGSPESLAFAASLTRRAAHDAGVSVDLVAVAPLRPAGVAVADVGGITAAAGRVAVLATGSLTPGRPGAGAGPPARLEALEAVADGGGEPAVVLVGRGCGFRDAAARVEALHRRRPVAAVVLEADEGVLVANRLAAGIPVVDEVDLAAVQACGRVAVEVAPAGHRLSLLGDAVALAVALRLGPAERADAVAAAAAVADAGAAVVGVDALPAAPTAAGSLAPWWVEVAGGRLALRDALAGVLEPAPGSVGRARLPGADGEPREVELADVFGLDLGALGAAASVRRHVLARRSLLVATLHADPVVDAAESLARELGAPVAAVPSEAAAARTGALTTPGAEAGAVVVDLGAGTADLIWPSAEVVGAGSGDLLTAAVAAAVGMSRSMAERAKREPSVRVQASQVVETEDGVRRFLERPVAAGVVGRLCVQGPAGLLPFDSRLTLGEWRALRLALKEAVLGRNLRRLLAGRERPDQVILVGGPAGDEEVVAVVAAALGPATAVGRGRVGAGFAGGAELGHRYAAALGLALAAGEASDQGA